MDFFSNFGIDDALNWGTAIVTIASIITGITNTPPKNSVWDKAYRIIEVLAIVNNKAKQKADFAPHTPKKKGMENWR